MKKLGIEELYVKIANKFLVLEGYLDDKLIGLVFRMCRLKPYDISTSAPKFSKHWIDEYRNSIHIENKKLKIVMNDLSIEEDKIGTTDLYGGLSINKTAKISKTALISKNILAFVGIDKYLRAFILNEKWHRCSPLLLGMDILKDIADNIDITYSKKLDIGDNTLWFDGNESWLTTMPIAKDLIDRFGLEEVIDG
jgi:hypothetical protein